MKMSHAVKYLQNHDLCTSLTFKEKTVLISYLYTKRSSIFHFYANWIDSFLVYLF